MRKIAYIFLISAMVFMLGGCKKTVTDVSDNSSSETAPADTVAEKEYEKKFSLLDSEYLFHCDSFISNTYGMAVDIDNEKVDVLVLSLADIDKTIHTTDLDESKELLSSYVFDSIKKPRGDYSDSQDQLPINSDEIITTSNGIEMLKVTGQIDSKIREETDIVDYTAYFFLDGESPIYVLASPKVGEKKSDIPNFDKDVDAFIQSIEKAD